MPRFWMALVQQCSMMRMWQQQPVVAQAVAWAAVVVAGAVAGVVAAASVPDHFPAAGEQQLQLLAHQRMKKRIALT